MSKKQVKILVAIIGCSWLLLGCQQNQKVEYLETTTQASIAIEIETTAEVETTESDPVPEIVIPIPIEPEPLEILFSGDIYLSEHVLQAYDANGVAGILDEGYRSAIESADFFMVNQEFAFSDRGEAAEDKQYTFRLPSERIGIFQELGIDGVSLANNHALDFGVVALQDSMDLLDSVGILRTGAGNNLEESKQAIRLEENGKRVSILGATRVIPVYEWGAQANAPGMLSTYDPTELIDAIKKEREISDYVIVYVHWGIERAEYPEEYQRVLGQNYIDAGADLVIGSHPHVLQGIEYYNGKPIVYSLGNFIFGSSIPSTALLHVTLDEEITLRWLPGTSSNGFTKMLASEVEKQNAYQKLKSLSQNIEVDEEGYINLETTP